MLIRPVKVCRTFVVVAITALLTVAVINNRNTIPDVPEIVVVKAVEAVEKVEATTATPSLKEVFDRRRYIISNICSTYNGNHTINNREYFINHDYKLVWCNIFKSASTSWINNFLVLAGVREQDVLASKKKHISYAREKIYPRCTLEEVQAALVNYTSFVIVREPFERLVSSYSDKIHNNHDQFYRSVRCRMSKRRTCNPSFAEFVDYILLEANVGNTLDEHWHPYSSFCSLCQVNYTYVLHFEKLGEEEKYFFDQVDGLPLKLEPKQLNSSNRNYSSLVPQYLKTLSRKQLTALVDLYEDDFNLGGYNYEQYLENYQP